MLTQATEALRARVRGISTGILAADLARLGEAAGHVGGWGGHMLHFDIMDGVFVPQLTAGPAFVAALDTGMVRDVHLMVADPVRQAGPFVAAGADIVTVHAEAPDALAALRAVRTQAERLQRPVLAGLAVMPSTPLADVEPLLSERPDLLLSLALDPRVTAPADVDLAGRRLRDLALAAGRHGGAPLLAIDGGITALTFAEALAFGPDVIVTGSAVFRAPVPAEAFAEMAGAFERAP